PSRFRLLVEHDLFRKPVSTFRDHAPDAVRPTGPCLYGGERKIGPAGPMKIDEITENFELLEDWDDRYRYVIELGRTLDPLPDALRTDANKVQGCASQVWLATASKPDGEAGPTLTFVGDSDAHIVRGLISILFALYSGRAARDILASDAVAL